jgi:hypothetical protein
VGAALSVANINIKKSARIDKKKKKKKKKTPDHTASLSKTWDLGPIYCTGVTAALLEAKFGAVPRARCVVLPLDTPTRVPLGPTHPGATATLVDARHCAGAAMVVLECRASFGRIVHTGDFRFDDAAFFDAHPRRRARLFGAPVDLLVLDNTYLDRAPGAGSSPPRRLVMRRIIEQCRAWVVGGGLDVVFGMDNLGKEEVPAAVAAAVEEALGGQGCGGKNFSFFFFFFFFFPPLHSALTLFSNFPPHTHKYTYMQQGDDIRLCEAPRVARADPRAAARPVHGGAARRAAARGRHAARHRRRRDGRRGGPPVRGSVGHRVDRGPRAGRRGARPGRRGRVLHGPARDRRRRRDPARSPPVLAPLHPGGDPRVCRAVHAGPQGAPGRRGPDGGDRAQGAPAARGNGQGAGG